MSVLPFFRRPEKYWQTAYFSKKLVERCLQHLQTHALALCLRDDDPRMKQLPNTVSQVFGPNLNCVWTKPLIESLTVSFHKALCAFDVPIDTHVAFYNYIPANFSHHIMKHLLHPAQDIPVAFNELNRNQLPKYRKEDIQNFIKTWLDDVEPKSNCEIKLRLADLEPTYYSIQYALGRKVISVIDKIDFKAFLQGALISLPAYVANTEGRLTDSPRVTL